MLREWSKVHKKEYDVEELKHKFQTFVDNYNYIKTLNDIYK
jgi:hypothetical protein